MTAVTQAWCPTCHVLVPLQEYRVNAAFYEHHNARGALSGTLDGTLDWVCGTCGASLGTVALSLRTLRFGADAEAEHRDRLKV